MSGLMKDERGVLGEAAGLLIGGVIVTYILIVFMGAMFPSVSNAIDAAAGGVAQAAAVKLVIGCLVLFIVLALGFKIWNLVSGSGGPQQQY